jgi:hypothetical protein
MLVRPLPAEFQVRRTTALSPADLGLRHPWRASCRDAATLTPISNFASHFAYLHEPASSKFFVDITIYYTASGDVLFVDFSLHHGFSRKMM